MITQDNANSDIQINFELMEEINYQKNSYIFFPLKSHILRATWFWRDDTGNFSPYPRDIADRLENFMDNAWFKNSQNRIDVSLGKKMRHVVQFSDGTFRQYRQAHDANPEGRLVIRGYKGKTIREIPEPVRMFWQFERVIWLGKRESTCFFAKIPENIIRRILSYCFQSLIQQNELLKLERSRLNSLKIDYDPNQTREVKTSSEEMESSCRNAVTRRHSVYVRNWTKGED